MNHVKWIYPEPEDDYSVHFLLDSEWTLCGLAYEGGLNMSKHDPRNNKQGFKTVNKKVTCEECIRRVLKCKEVKSTEFIKPTH
jgi:hypothetical protein